MTRLKAGHVYSRLVIQPDVSQKRGNHTKRMRGLAFTTLITGLNGAIRDPKTLLFALTSE